MSQTFQQIEAALLPIAIPYTPEGSDPKAVVHQWVHAVAYGYSPFAEYQGVSKEHLIKILTAENLYTSAMSFKKKLLKTPIKPTSENTFTFIDLFAGIGGMRLGFQHAGGICVFSSEFEKNAQAAYYENYRDYPFEDRTKVAV